MVDFPGGDVTIPYFGATPVVVVAGVAGGTLGLGVLLLRRARGGGAAAGPVVPVTGAAAAPAPAVASLANNGTDNSAALASLGQSFAASLADSQAATAKALGDQQAATTAALGGSASAQTAAYDNLFGLFTQDTQARDARDAAARDQQAATDAAQNAAQQGWWQKVLDSLGKAPPVDAVTGPAPATGQQGSGNTPAEWTTYAANASALYDMKRHGYRPAGTELVPYRGNTRLAVPSIRLPKAYNPAQDTKGFEFNGAPQEILLVRAARKTADLMVSHPDWDQSVVMLGYLRTEAQSSGGWAGTGFTPGPADVAAGYP